MVTTVIRVAVVIRNNLKKKSFLMVVFVVLVKLKIGWDLNKTACKVLSPKCLKKVVLTHISHYLFKLYCFLCTFNCIFGLKDFFGWQPPFIVTNFSW